VHSALHCHSNETCTLIANVPNSAQLDGIPYHSPQVTSGSMQYCGNAVTETHRQTHTDTSHV